jgi:RNA 2',3'-cyclic 3'-phosphodiesterase
VSTERIRCFFALPLRSSDLATLLPHGLPTSPLPPGMPSTLRFAASDQLHVTLKFLGSIAQSQIDELALRLSSHARRTRVFSVAAGAVTAFPNLQRARVLVLRLNDEAEHIARLANALETDAEALGVAREQRRFKAHVTLARLKHPTNVREAAAQLAVQACGLTFDEVTLFASKLGPGGSRYSVLASAKFGLC